VWGIELRQGEWPLERRRGSLTKIDPVRFKCQTREPRALSPPKTLKINTKFRTSTLSLSLTIRPKTDSNKPQLLRKIAVKLISQRCQRKTINKTNTLWETLPIREL
jgi:hypothetical protein